MLVLKTLWQEHEKMIISFSQIRIYTGGLRVGKSQENCVNVPQWRGMEWVLRSSHQDPPKHKNVWKDIHQSANGGYLQVAGIWGLKNLAF